MTTVPMQSGRRVSTLATEPLRTFKFHVLFSPVTTYSPTQTTNLWDEKTLGGFMSVSGLSVTTDSISYREGGYNTTAHQVPGLTQFSPINMQRGMMKGSSQAIQSMGRVFSATSGRADRVASDANPNYRYNIRIRVLNHPRDIVSGVEDITNAGMQFTVFNAWLASVAYSDLNAGENGVFVEQMSWVHEGFEASILGGADDTDNIGPVPS